nr:MAG TPA: hypothetical protein [Caudoviricetes sp.]DAW01902.1 MAG TPA: hypothetical protein [Caudoviricetes sp.]
MLYPECSIAYFPCEKNKVWCPYTEALSVNRFLYIIVEKFFWSDGKTRYLTVFSVVDEGFCSGVVVIHFICFY